MLATVERLRLREGYSGYIHLKLIPGASFEYVERAVELADRVSLNLEAPNQARLSDLAPDKEFAGSLWGRLAWAAEFILLHVPHFLKLPFPTSKAKTRFLSALQSRRRRPHVTGRRRRYFATCDMRPAPSCKARMGSVKPCLKTLIAIQIWLSVY
jgi:hypothetical protein